MTPASALSRLEKLAEKESWRYLVSIPAQRRDIERACVNVGKALLQILSEPGEACGPPRAWLCDSEDQRYYTEGDIGEWGTENLVEFCEVSELLQARAAHALEHEQWKDAVTRGNSFAVARLNKELASSEARVRILTEALRELLNKKGQRALHHHSCFTETWGEDGNCTGRELECRCGLSAAEALLEVKP